MKHDLQSDFTLTHENGLHARPAALLVKTANRFESRIRVSHGGPAADGKSIMGVLSLGVECGSRVRVEISGTDAAEAMAAIADLFQRAFQELEDPPPAALRREGGFLLPQEG